jgi:hypothetical protein
MTIIYTAEPTPGPRAFGTTTGTLITAAPMRAAFFSSTEVSAVSQPHDIPNLNLASVALAADARVEELRPRDY